MYFHDNHSRLLRKLKEKERLVRNVSEMQDLQKPGYIEIGHKVIKLSRFEVLKLFYNRKHFKDSLKLFDVMKVLIKYTTPK